MNHELRSLSISDREAAITEAVVFGILQGFNVDPTIRDQPDSGGPDFICFAYHGRCHHDLPKIG